MTAIASYIITRNQHRHDETKHEITARRALLQRVSEELAGYYGAPTRAQHVLNLHARGRVGDEAVHTMLDDLIRGHERLAAVIYTAALLGDRQLAAALDEYWTAANSFYLEVRRGSEISTTNVNEQLHRLSDRSVAVRESLAISYSRISTTRSKSRRAADFLARLFLRAT